MPWKYVNAWTPSLVRCGDVACAAGMFPLRCRAGGGAGARGRATSSCVAFAEHGGDGLATLRMIKRMVRRIRIGSIMARARLVACS
jgi:hypothetical protein